MRVFCILPSGWYKRNGVERQWPSISAQDFDRLHPKIVVTAPKTATMTINIATKRGLWAQVHLLGSINPPDAQTPIKIGFNCHTGGVLEAYLYFGM